MGDVDFESERDALMEITPEMLESGVQAFRAWEDQEGYLSHPDESYPFYDCALERGLRAVYRAMQARARSVA